MWSSIHKTILTQQPHRFLPSSTNPAGLHPPQSQCRELRAHGGHMSTAAPAEHFRSGRGCLKRPSETPMYLMPQAGIEHLQSNCSANFQVYHRIERISSRETCLSQHLMMAYPIYTFWIQYSRGQEVASLLPGDVMLQTPRAQSLASFELELFCFFFPPSWQNSRVNILHNKLFLKKQTNKTHGKHRQNIYSFSISKY